MSDEIASPRVINGVKFRLRTASRKQHALTALNTMTKTMIDTDISIVEAGVPISARQYSTLVALTSPLSGEQISSMGQKGKLHMFGSGLQEPTF